MRTLTKRRRSRHALARTAFCLLLAVLAVAGAASAEEDFPLVQTVFNERSGLPTGEANDVLQTSDGYIWAGSYGGLIRYDGSEFRNYSAEGLLPSSSVRMMHEDAQGRLWIGTNDAGVFVMENGEITAPQGQPTDNFLCIRGFAEGADGMVYACSNSGIGQIQDGVMTIYDDPEVAGKTAYAIGVDRYGRVWGSTDSSGGCVVLRGGRVEALVRSSDYFKDGEGIYSVSAGADGTIWLGGSDNHIVRLEFLGEGFGPEDIQATTYTLEQVSVINSMRETSGALMAASGLHGYALVSPESGVVLEISEEEGASNINSSDVDYEGNIWLASTEQGLVKYSEGCFAPYAEDMFSGISLNAIAILGDKGYVGSNNGLAVVGGGGDPAEQALVSLLEGVQVRDIKADSRGNIWVASYSENPVVCYNPASGQTAVFSTDNGLCNDRARVLAELQDGSIAVGTQSGLSIIAEGQVQKSYTDFAYPTILSLLEMPDGTLLAGSDGGGIYAIKDGAVAANLSFAQGLAEGVVLRILRDTGDNCFVSAGSSLYYMRDGRFEKLTALKKEAGSIFDLYLRDGKLWLLQNSAVLAVNREDLLAGGDGDPMPYSFKHGLAGSLNANTQHCLYNGQLYLATRSGVSVFSFRMPENVRPRVTVNSVIVDGVTYEHPERVTVDSGARRVDINYAVLSYSTASRFHTTYTLEGFDKAGSLTDSERNFVSYTNLRGGEYTFKLQVSDPNSGQSAQCSFQLVKEKKLSEQPLFWTAVVVLTIAAVVGAASLVYSVKLRNARRRQREYRDILEQSLLTFAGTIDAKDKYTNGHSTRVAQYSRELARRMGMTPEEQENIYYVALLHDIGKIGVPDQVLNKPGKLTPEEREIIQQHPVTGAEILKNFTSLKGIADGARFHHEQYNGKGYCEGRAGEDIPLTARIIAVADTYDAMASDRCYRKGLPREVIEEELKKGSGKQFDPKIVPHMLAIIAEGGPLEQNG